MEMTPDNWNKAKKLFEAAMACAPSQRASFLAQNCLDPSLRRQVEKLLVNDQEAGSFLSDPVLNPRIPALTKGTKLGDYEITSLVGAGGMGEVYRARDTVLKREVAIKVLPAYLSRDPERLRRFEVEAQAAATLNHPNIVSIFHVGQYDGSPYIVTELLQGETLRERLRKGRLREALEFAIDMARGLGAAHDAGVIHRDLKPENLFITKDGRIKILDFGLAKLESAKAASGDGSTVTLQHQTSPGHVLGTVGYMSPEQVRGQAADARSDIFAAGVVLYEMLTGKPAFRKATSAETMSAILNEDPPAVSQIAPNLPPGLQRIVNRCLAKSPEQRFQHATDLAFALEALSDSSGGILSAVQQPASSRKLVWIATSAAILAVAAAVIIWWSRPSTLPVVEAVTQLSDDGEPKPDWSYLAADGSRVYFNEGQIGTVKIAQVAVTGGPTAVIPTKFANPQIVGLSPEGSALLALVAGLFGWRERPAYPLWEIPLPAGQPRRLGSIEAQDAGFFPDGRIVFARGADLYIAEKDGSSPRKLVSITGSIAEPSVSPDGRQLAFTTYTTSSGIPIGIVKIRADGSGLQPIVMANLGERVCCARWTPDGNYLLFRRQHEGRWDLWIYPLNTGFFHRSRQLVPLTTGPLSYSGAIPSRDGKQIFAIGAKQRGELVYYDTKSNQFLPFLSGISAFNLTVSRDGQWVAYTSYPDGNLWRSRADGSERLQITFPPMGVEYPFISPDGKRVAFGNPNGETYVISMEGGAPQKVLERESRAANWSPDGSLLLFTHWIDSDHPELQILDFRSGKVSVLPSSQGLQGGQWVSQDMLVAAARGFMEGFAIFDLKTHKWSNLVPGRVINWAHSLDYKHLYYTTGGAEPKAMRIRLADRKVETITSLKDLRRAQGSDGNTQISVAPDGSPVFTRDIGTQEIYALTVKWP